MPSAKRFTNEAALVSALRQCQWKESFRRGRREECDCDLKTIILHSVGRNHPEYTEWLYDLSDHFRRFWKKQMQGKEISYGPSLKLSNLLLKQLCLYREISDKSCERLIQYLEVPLDSYTIQAVASQIEDGKRKRCAEILVPDIIEPEHILDVVCSPVDDIDFPLGFRHLRVDIPGFLEL